MNKLILVVAVAALGAAGAYFWMSNQPEPTPAERLEDAVKDAGDALKDAGSAISDGVRETSAGLKTEAENATAAMAEAFANSADKLSDQAAAVVKAWQDTEILTSDGFNHDNAVKVVEDSTLDEETKSKIIEILGQIRDAPDQFEQKLAELRDVLEQAM